MPTFSKHSVAELATAHPKLRQVFGELISFLDFSILDGARTIEEQKKNVARGVSKTMDSKHVVAAPGEFSHAVDAALYPQRWEDPARAHLSQWEVDQLFFAGIVVGYARANGIKLRFGGDWNGDFRNIATGFRDLPHFELVEPSSQE